MTIIAVPMDVILSQTATANPFVEIVFLRREKSAMEIAPQAARTKMHAPRIRCWVLQQPVAQLACTPLSSRAFREMPAAHQAAIALTTTIVLHTAPIMSSSREKSAMGIVPARVMMALSAHRMPLTGAHKAATQSAYSRTLPPAHKATDAARMGVTITAITTAHPVVEIALSRQTKPATGIARPLVATPTPVPPTL